MKPKKKLPVPQDDMFRSRLEDIVSPTHPFVRLSQVIDWERIDRELDHHFATVGAASLPTRIMTGLMFLQHMHNLSDEALLDRWLESPYYQYFCGETFFQHKQPCHPTCLIKWRQRLGEEGCEWLLTETINAGLNLGAVKPASLK